MPTMSSAASARAQGHRPLADALRAYEMFRCKEGDFEKVVLNAA